MSQSLFLSNRPTPVTDSIQPLFGDDSKRRALRENLGILILFGLALVAILNLPIERIFESLFKYDQYRLFLIASSFAIVTVAIRRRQQALRESTAHEALVRDLTENSRIENQLNQLSSLLHTCFTLEEVGQVIPSFAQQLFPGYAGALYIFRNSPNLLELAAHWGNANAPESMFTTDHCWALHQGQMFVVPDPSTNVLCQHVNHGKPYVCLPMMAHGEILALLHVYPTGDAAVESPMTEAQQNLLYRFVEHIALPLSNLKLRDTLRQQSIRDSLTGLFNRRYLDEVLPTEIERARRANSFVSVIMLDIDNFRQFNDIYGHEAGDAVLQALGRFLYRYTREGDIVFRHGGEEFALILPGASADIAQKRAEELCQGVHSLRTEFQGQTLGPGSVSLGIATFPNHGENATLVLTAADASLIQAKSEGRDRVVLAA
ncbi:MAG: sensor domain-containing diguanylate cyclase [Chloroflexi bacterium]|nr:sensor domain-containing diguanylate cyclase [Chloroflexota bacterium]